MAPDPLAFAQVGWRRSEDRYPAQVHATPSEARNALLYVINNAKHHAAESGHKWAPKKDIETLEAALVAAGYGSAWNPATQLKDRGGPGTGSSRRWAACSRPTSSSSPAVRAWARRRWRPTSPSTLPRPTVAAASPTAAWCRRRVRRCGRW